MSLGIAKKSWLKGSQYERMGRDRTVRVIRRRKRKDEPRRRTGVVLMGKRQGSWLEGEAGQSKEREDDDVGRRTRRRAERQSWNFCQCLGNLAELILGTLFVPLLVSSPALYHQFILFFFLFPLLFYCSSPSVHQTMLFARAFAIDLRTSPEI